MHSVSRSLLAAGVVALAGLTACGDKVQLTQLPTPVATKDSSVQSVSVTPSTALIQVNGTQLFVANVVGGKDLVNRNVTWTSSNTAVATVDANGLATAKGAGQTTIVATSAANTAVKGAAVLTVNALAPASLSFFGVNNSIGQPATLNNANGQLNIVANVDPGQSGLTNLQLLLICPKSTGTGSDTTVVGSSNVSGTTGTQTQQQVTIPFNTAAFNQTTGVPSYLNGTCSLGLVGRTATGTQVISASGPQLTLNNTDVAAGTIAGARNATDPAGLRWDGGAVTVTLLPIFYSGQAPASLSVTLTGTDNDAAATVTATAAAAKDANGVWTATFAEGTAAHVNGSSTIGNDVTVPSFTATVNGVSTSGQPIPTFAVRTVQAAQTGTTTAASIRYDNENPVAPTYTFATQNPSYAGTSGFINASYNFAATPTTGTGFSGLGAAGAACLTASNGTLCDHQGVDKVTASYAYFNGAAPAVTSTSWVNITSASSIPESASGSQYSFRFTVCDALNNCTASVSPQTFGVDVTAPTATATAIPADQQAATSAANLQGTGNLTISAVDSASAGGVSGSGFAASPVFATLTQTTSAGTTCVAGWGTPNTAGDACASPAAKSFSSALPAAEGYYTLTYYVVDLAGNRTATKTVTYAIDGSAPVVSNANITIPGTITQGTSFTAAATDNLDITGASGSLNYTAAALSLNETATASPAGSFGTPLTTSASITETLSTFYRSLTTAAAAIGEKPASVDIRATDVAGNTGEANLLLPAANISAPTAAPFATVTSFALTSSAASVSNGTGTTNPKSTTLKASATIPGTAASPFTQVCFYYLDDQAGSPTNGDYILISCQTGAAVTDVGGNRTYEYSISFDPASRLGTSGSQSVIAIGSNANLDAYATAPATFTRTN